MHGDQVSAQIFLVPGVLGLLEQLNTDQLVGIVGVIFQVPLDDVLELVAPDLQIGGVELVNQRDKAFGIGHVRFLDSVTESSTRDERQNSSSSNALNSVGRNTFSGLSAKSGAIWSKR